MKDLVFEKKGNDTLYVQLYYYFRRLIECGQLENNSKMMSIRRCCEEFGLSKTTVENPTVINSQALNTNTNQINNISNISNIDVLDIL